MALWGGKHDSAGVPLAHLLVHLVTCALLALDSISFAPRGAGALVAAHAVHARAAWLLRAAEAAAVVPCADVNTCLAERAAITQAVTRAP